MFEYLTKVTMKPNVMQKFVQKLICELNEIICEIDSVICIFEILRYVKFHQSNWNSRRSIHETILS